MFETYIYTNPLTYKYQWNEQLLHTSKRHQAYCDCTLTNILVDIWDCEHFVHSNISTVQDGNIRINSAVQVIVFMVRALTDNVKIGTYINGLWSEHVFQYIICFRNRTLHIEIKNLKKLVINQCSEKTFVVKRRHFKIFLKYSIVRVFFIPVTVNN